MTNRINKSFILTITSSLLIVLGVFLPFVKLKINIVFMGILNAQEVLVDCWNHGDGDGKYLLMVACISLVFAFMQKYKWLWIPAAICTGVIIYSIVDSLMNASSMAKGPYADMAKSMMQNTKISIIPREGLFLLVAGLGLLVVVAVLGLKRSKIVV